MTRKRFKADDWLDHGLAQLAEHGPDALKLDAICESAGRTKGSFYHHFPDHRHFLTALVQHWIAKNTHAVIKALPDEMSADEKDRALTDLAINLDYRLELGIRELCRRNTTLSQLLAQADSTRMAFLSDLYAERYGIAAEDARFAAQIEYAAYVGTILTKPDMTEAEQRALADRFQSVMGTYFKAGS